MFILNVRCAYQHSLVVKDLRTHDQKASVGSSPFWLLLHGNIKLSLQNSSALKHTHLNGIFCGETRVCAHHLCDSSTHKILGRLYLSLDLTTKHMFLCQYFSPSTNTLRITCELFCLATRPQLCPEHQTKSKPGHFPHLPCDFYGCPSPLFHIYGREL